MKVQIVDQKPPEDLVELELIQRGSGGVMIKEKGCPGGPNLLYIDERGIHICGGYTGKLPVDSARRVLHNETG